MADKFQAVVIGGGPGGYVCAIRLAQLGMKTALVEKYKTLGGTCLNVGCIPSKSLLDSSHHYEELINNFDAHGIEVPEGLKINFEKMISRKSKVVEDTTKGINYLMDKNKIKVFYGHASFSDKESILLSGSKEKIYSKNCFDRILGAKDPLRIALVNHSLSNKLIQGGTKNLK